MRQTCVQETGCDTVLIGDDGPERLTKLPRKLFSA